MRKLLLVLLAGMFPMWFFTALRADVAVAGGTENQRVVVQSVYQSCIAARFHTRQTVQVRLIDDQRMDLFLSTGGDDLAANRDDYDTIDGVFEDGPPEITLRDSRPDDEIQHTIAHEYGHYVWRHLMSRSDRAEYKRIYKMQLNCSSLVSGYAGANLLEGFAEAFSFYSTAPDVLQDKDPVSFHFIDTLFDHPHG